MRNNAAKLTFLLAIMDSFCVLVAYAVAAWYCPYPEEASTFQEAFGERLPYFIVFVLVWCGAAADQRLFVSRRDSSLRDQAASIVRAILMTIVFSGFVVAFFRQGSFDPWFMAWFTVLTVTLIVAFRLTVRLVLWWLRRKGFNYRRIVIVGANNRAKHFAEVLSNHEEYGYVLLGILDDDPERMRLLEPLTVTHLGPTQRLEEILVNEVVDEVFITLPVRSYYSTIEGISHLCEGIGVTVRLVADFFPLRIARRHIDVLEDVPLLSLSAIPQQQLQLYLKRLFDITASGIGLLFLLPFMFLPLAILIKLDSSGPVYFRQERVGMNQRRFQMLKFRSMVTNAEELRKELEAMNEADGPVFKIRRDPRITRVGRYLRKFSLDEFPQLINVFLGHMSLVGPRPPLPDEVAEYTWDQRRRLSVRPGMTGLWQVSGRSDTSFTEWVQMDLEYIDHWSLALDFKILIKTLGVVLRGRGAA